MPHVIRAGLADLQAAWRGLPTGPWRWGNAVGRVEGRFLGHDPMALLVAGVVVEYGRPLHPVVVVSHRDAATAVHLWPVASVERTEAVKRFLAQVAHELGGFGAGAVTNTNIQSLLP